MGQWGLDPNPSHQQLFLRGKPSGMRLRTNFVVGVTISKLQQKREQISLNLLINHFVVYPFHWNFCITFFSFIFDYKSYEAQIRVADFRCGWAWTLELTYNDVIIAIASLINHFIQGADQRKHQSSASLAFVRGIHRWPVNSSHKGPVAVSMFPFDHIIMEKWCETKSK